VGRGLEVEFPQHILAAGNYRFTAMTFRQLEQVFRRVEYSPLARMIRQTGPVKDQQGFYC
jgi:hypothetical protein